MDEVVDRLLAISYAEVLIPVMRMMDSIFYGIPGKVHRKNWKRFAKPLPNNREKP